MAYLLPNSTFIHIPKTAGQWAAAALENAGLVVDRIGVVHASPDELEQEEEFRRRNFRFTFVRHPAAWYQSMWAHRIDEEWEPIDDPEWFTPKWIDFWAEFTGACHSNSFEGFLRKCVAHYPSGFVSTLYDAYTNGSNFIGKYENLVEDICTALDQASESYDQRRIIETEPRNVRGKRPHRRRGVEYSSDLLELILNTEMAAIKKYGYEEVPASVIR